MKVEFKHKKSLGQNFLINKTILKKISSLKDFKNQEVVEVGPGKGYLTEFLIKKKTLETHSYRKRSTTGNCAYKSDQK
jgi:16S rRNA (adenine1518-N6/adenine1519-N6)-dimethyltransferase